MLSNDVLFTTILVCSLRSVVEPASVFDGHLVALLWPVNPVAALDELFL